jgi:ABC-type transport system involved in multi-copper enzyme maturation permease subunit
MKAPSASNWPRLAQYFSEWRRLAQFSLWNNPILVKEVRTRMRGNRAFVLLTVHLLILAVALALIYLIISLSQATFNNPGDRRTLGKLIFGLLVWMELVMVSFTSPALTSGAISLERERQTFDLLKVTLLKARSLALGKYFAGLVFVLLLLVSALPLFGPPFLLGGIQLEEILIAVLILATSAVVFCAVGLFLSSLFARTLVASVLAYAFAILMNFGIPIMMLLMITVLGARFSGLAAPASLWTVLWAYVAWLGISLTPPAAMIATEVALIDGQGVWLARLPLDGRQLVFISPWIIYVGFYLLLSLALIWLSIKLVARAER